MGSERSGPGRRDVERAGGGQSGDASAAFQSAYTQAWVVVRVVVEERSTWIKQWGWILARSWRGRGEAGGAGLEESS